MPKGIALDPFRGYPKGLRGGPPLFHWREHFKLETVFHSKGVNPPPCLYSLRDKAR